MLKKVVQNKKIKKVMVLYFKHHLKQLFKLRNTETNNDLHRQILVLEFSNFIIIILITYKNLRNDEKLNFS